MLMAYEGTIKDIPTEDTRVPLRPIQTLSDAKRILAGAKRNRTDLRWEIKGTGPYGVHGQP